MIDKETQYGSKCTQKTPPYNMERQISHANDSGFALPKKIHSFMGSRFGSNFSYVKVHTDSTAVQMNQELNAQAFTHKNDIYFNSGRYNPDTSSGKQLLAHELTHVMQQNGSHAKGDDIVQRQPACQTSVPEQTIDVYIVELPGSRRNSTNDVSVADTVWKQCGIRVNMSGGESWQTNLLDINTPNGVLNAPSSTTRALTTEETEMLSYKPGGSVIHAYYVPDFSGPKVGEAFWPSFHGDQAFAISNSARTEVFAHELGHVLLDTGNHEPNGSNIMARNIQSVGGRDLRCDQCP